MSPASTGFDQESDAEVLTSSPSSVRAPVLSAAQIAQQSFQPEKQSAVKHDPKRWWPW